ncbi:MAG: hydrogenase [Acidobacteria bacterium]|nr:MAG: hydrogenase [Acidobacteriota bacterium]
MWLVPLDEFRSGLLKDLQSGARVSAFFAVPELEGSQLHAVLADGMAGEFRWWITRVGDAYPALTPECPQFHWFERELFEQWEIRPEGHPWLKPIRFQRSYGSPDAPEILPSVTDFFAVEGEEIHEVAVGPVHAGVIEPGHFRFQCHGEEVFHLEISLGYQHRGIERAVMCGPDKRTIHLIETLAGDTSIGHATAYCQALEALAGVQPSGESEVWRAIALELERLANHTGDLGALANDVGYLPTASYCGRIRGDFLNMTALICGNRFGRRLVRPGGLGVGIGPEVVVELRKRLDQASVDARSAIDLLWLTPSVRARFENTGRISAETALEIGLVGPAARASGLERDARREFKAGVYRDIVFTPPTQPDGNVQARAWVRWLELQQSISLIRQLLDRVEQGYSSACGAAALDLAPNAAVVSVVEGWRGEICHVAMTDSQGRFRSYKIVDPSFHNWMGLALALRNQQISDFPLCNKSFNLSYCGHDL